MKIMGSIAIAVGICVLFGDFTAHIVEAIYKANCEAFQHIVSRGVGVFSLAYGIAEATRRK